MTSDTKHIPGIVIGDHSTNPYGGVVAHWKNEAAELSEATPTFRSIELTAF